MVDAVLSCAKKRSIQSDELESILGELFGDSDAEIRTAALNASRSLGIRFFEQSLAQLAGVVISRQTSTSLRIEALRTLDAQNYSKLDALIQVCLTSRKEAVRIRALKLLNRDSAAALTAIKRVLSKSKALRERQSAITLLAKLKTSGGDHLLAAELTRLSKGTAFPGTELEILEAARSRATHHVALTDLLKEADAVRGSNPDADRVTGFSECLTGGDATAGKDVFMTHITVQCIRCHRVGKTGSTVGPNLESIALKRDAKYLLRSIIAPSADIEPKYRTQTLIMDSGKIVIGLLLRKDDNVTVLADAQGKEVVVKNDEIDEAVEQRTSIMPDMTKVLSRRDIRNLVSYLKTLRKSQPKSSSTE